MKLDDAINLRFSCRKFKSKKPNWRNIIEAVDAARKAPLAGNIPSLKFILIDKPEIIASLAQESQQSFVADVHYVVAVVSEKVDVVRNFEERGERYTQYQAGAAIENFLLKITDLGLATCWVGAFVDDNVKNILQVPSDLEVVALFPIGYALREEKQKRKPSLDRVMRFNSYGEKRMSPWKTPEAI